MWLILVSIKMRIYIGLIFLIYISFSAKAQYDFEKYPSIQYDIYEWENIELEKSIIHKIDIPNFYKNSDSLNLKLIYFNNSVQDSEILISKQKFYEDIPFTLIGLDSLRIADINGDGLKDLKIISYYMGNGLASLNVKVVYFFQDTNRRFIKIAYDDKMGDNRSERDFDNDGNFEIITMKLQHHKNHNYWLFNIYNFLDNKIMNVNNKANYPIMIQLLNSETFDISNNLSRDEMKVYEIKSPTSFDD